MEKKFLAETHPELAKEWHPTKNPSLTPYQVTQGSDKKVWWLCSEDSRHEWFAKVGNRARRGIGCPVCAGKLVIPGVNDMATTHPEMAAEWDTEHNSLPATQVVAGSGKKAHWVCRTCSHKWMATPNTRSYRGTGCPLCAGQVVVAGKNDLATTHPDLARDWHPTKNSLSPEQVSRGNKKHVWWLCQHCGNEWRSTIIQRAGKRSGCPSCRIAHIKPGNTLQDKYPEVAAEWDFRKNMLTPDKVAAMSNKKAHWVCSLGHEWVAPIARRTHNGAGCPACSSVTKRVIPGFNDFATLYPDLAKEWDHENNTVKPTEIAGKSGVKAHWVCKLGHKWVANVYERVRPDQPTGCPTCANRKVLPGYNDLQSQYPLIAAEWHPTKNDKIPSEVGTNSGHRAWWICDKGHEWQTTVHHRTKGGTGCRLCSLNGTSRAEQDVFALVQTLAPDAKLHDRSIAKGYEYDISVPSKKVAVEYNGVYWHSEEFKAKNYHLDKALAAMEENWRVITVWEDDWLTKLHVVEKMLAHKLGASTQPKYNARSLSVRDVNTQDARIFLNENHIQGQGGGSIRYGLYAGTKLVALMLFLRRDNEGTYELTRFATNGLVRGGFSKLFKHFTRNNPQAKTVISFSDLEVSDGGVYTRNGFVQGGVLDPDYKYVVNGLREHKFKYRKRRFKNDPDLLWEEGLTETELAELNGIPRAYDSGKTKWVWYNNMI